MEAAGLPLTNSPRKSVGKDSNLQCLPEGSQGYSLLPSPFGYQRKIATVGLEPTTPSSSAKRSTNWSYVAYTAGGSRTHKICILSATRIPFHHSGKFIIPYPHSDSNRDFTALKAVASAVGLCGLVGPVFPGCHLVPIYVDVTSNPTDAIGESRTPKCRFTGAVLCH